MKGDFTRDTFSLEKQYQAVLMQQGRAQLDADWNEQAAIAVRRDETTARDIAGRCGGPKGGAAFAVMLHGPDGKMAPAGDFYLSAGRYYVDGIQCELEKPVRFSKQKNRGFLDEKNETIREGKRYLLYLDVWRRHVTALEDPAIRETALGGPDTASRVQTVWQARLLELSGEEAEGALCGNTFPSFDKATAASTGTLAAYTKPEDAKPSPCAVPAGAGYTGLENQLYRVEIHQPGTAGKATYKWSRDNGIVAAAVLGVDGNRITVSTLGPDEALGFARDQLVELIDDTLELEGKPGQLVRIAEIPTGGRTIVLENAVAAPLAGLDAAQLALRHAKVRRWDGTGTVPNEGARKLESGIAIQFSPDPKRTYRTGDYWLIPARAATAESPTGDIEWPQDGGAPAFMRPHGIRHHYCKLALLRAKAPTEKGKRGLNYLEHTDCRCLWPPLTEPKIEYIGGDGQEVMPDLKRAAGDPPTLFRLPYPLSVRVTNMQCAGRKLALRFLITSGNGILWFVPTPAVEHPADISTPGVQEVTVADAAGIVSCDWYLDGVNTTQQVEAALVDDKGTIVCGPILFTASLNVAKNVAYLPEKCEVMANAKPPVKTVHDAIEFLCRQKRGGCCEVVDPRDQSRNIPSIVAKAIEEKRTDICLCLLGGDVPHKLPKGWKIERDDQEVHLRLVGCGQGARIEFGDSLVFEGLASLTLRDLELNSLFVGEKPTEVMVAAGGCMEVSITGCRITGIVPATTLVGIGGFDRILLRDSVLEAGRSKGLEAYVGLMEAGGAGSLGVLFSDCTWPGFKGRSEKAAEKFFKDNDAAARAALGKKLAEAYKESGLESVLSRAEIQALLVLLAAIMAKKGDSGLLVNALTGLRAAAFRALGADALVVMPVTGMTGEAAELADPDAGSRVVIEDNDITGHVSLNGFSSDKQFDPEMINKAREMYKKTPPNVLPLGGMLQLRGNRLTRLMLAAAVVDQVSGNISANNGNLPAPFARSTITDNVIDAAGSLIVTGWLTMSGNQFSLAAQRAQAAATPGTFTTHYTFNNFLALALVFSRQGVYVGNQSNQPATIVHVDAISDGAANLGISI